MNINNKNINENNMNNIYLDTNIKYFENNIKNWKLFVGIINREVKISLRLIDWFVTNYSKQYDVNYKIEINGQKDIFNVYREYKSKLKEYSKKYFDPFKRKATSSFNLKIDGTSVDTNIKQLNYFRWALSSKIITYIKKHKDEITLDMKERKQERDATKSLTDSIIMESETMPDETEEVKKYSDGNIIDLSSDSINNKTSSQKKRQKLTEHKYSGLVMRKKIPMTIKF